MMPHTYIRSQAHAGWTLLRAKYEGGGFSGGKTDRPALRRLLDDVRAGKADVIVVYKVDRLTRSLTDFAKLVELFDEHNVSFTTSMGRLTLNVLLSFAQFEREVTSERIRDKIAASKRKGLWVGGMAPLGYDTKDRKITVNRDQGRRIGRAVREPVSVDDKSSLRRRGSFSAGKRFAEARDRRTEMARELSRTPNRDQIQSTHRQKAPQKMRLRAQCTKTPVRSGLRGGAGRTRTCNQIIMERQARWGSAMLRFKGHLGPSVSGLGKPFTPTPDRQNRRSQDRSVTTRKPVDAAPRRRETVCIACRVRT
jgi:hypothetical protein